MRQAYASRLEGLGAAKAATEPGDTCTTHLTVVDGEGNLVAMTTTLLSSMGSRYVLPGSGVLMNNGMMWFDPRPGSANAIAPGARPLCNMCPIIVTPKDGAWPRCRGRRLGRTADSRQRLPDAGLHAGLRRRCRDGGALAAHRRLRPGFDQRRSAPAGRDAGGAGAGRARSAWSSMACCRSTSPVPTSSASIADGARGHQRRDLALVGGGRGEGLSPRFPALILRSRVSGVSKDAPGGSGASATILRDGPAGLLRMRAEGLDLGVEMDGGQTRSAF